MRSTISTQPAGNRRRPRPSPARHLPSTRRRPLLDLVAVPFVFAVLIAVPSGAAGQQGADWCSNVDRSQHCEVRELTLEALNDRLAVNARPNGGIRVEGWNGSEVRVEARVTSRSSSASAAAELAGEVTVRVEPGRVWSDGPRTRGRESWSVSFRVLVPHGTDLELESTNGGINVAGVRGAVQARTTNGGIRLEDVDGRVNARTTNGGIHAEFRAGSVLTSPTELRATNGGITVRIPDGFSANVEASTTNGGISTDFPITVQGRLRRNLSGVLGEGGPELRLSTTNGAIRLQRG